MFSPTKPVKSKRKPCQRTVPVSKRNYIRPCHNLLNYLRILLFSGCDANREWTRMNTNFWKTLCASMFYFVAPKKKFWLLVALIDLDLLRRGARGTVLNGGLISRARVNREGATHSARGGRAPHFQRWGSG